MRRRTVVDGRVPVELRLESIRPLEVVDSPAAHREWMEVFDDWRRRRELWAQVNEWPGGDAERLREEWSVHVPDAPFDGTGI